MPEPSDVAPLAAEGHPFNFRAAFQVSGRCGARTDQVLLLFGCMSEGCEVEIELVVDVAATLQILEAHQVAHAPMRDAAKLAELFGPDGQPVARSRPGLLDT